MTPAIKPTSTWGRWALALTLAFVVLMALKVQTFVPLPSPAIALLGLAGFVLALLALTRRDDRAILIIVPVLIGAVILLWTTGELLFPH